MNLPIAPSEKTNWPWVNASGLPGKRLSAYPKISIVTPTFRHGHYLEETIRSVLLQGYPNLEYIVIDGGSKDETIGVLKKYDNFIHYWVSESDRGHAHALNKGFAQATGEILAWINAGDFYFPQALHRVAQVFQEFSEVAWLTTAQPGRYQSNTGATTYYMPGFSESFFLAGGYLGFEPFSLGFIQQESTFWRKSLWDYTGGCLNESLSMANDFELWSKFFRHTKIALLDAPLGCFRVHADQRSAAKSDLYKQEAWSCLGRSGNIVLLLAYRIFQKLRLHKFSEWRVWLTPVYGEKTLVVSFNDVGKLLGEWRKLV